MPVNGLFRDGKIKPEEVERLNRAFSFTLRSLSLVDRDNDPLCEIVAHKVIEIDAAGIHDPKEIASLAIKQLGLPEDQRGIVRSNSGTCPVGCTPFTCGDANPMAIVSRTTLAHMTMRKMRSIGANDWIEYTFPRGKLHVAPGLFPAPAPYDLHGLAVAWVEQRPHLSRDCTASTWAQWN